MELEGFKRVQVKTATINKSGPREYLQVRTQLTNKYQKFKPIELYDLLVVVYNEELWVIDAGVITSSNLSLRNQKWNWYKEK